MKEIEKDVPVTATLFRTEQGRYVIEIHVDGILLFDEDLTHKSGGWLEWARVQFDLDADSFLCENCGVRFMEISNQHEVFCSYCGTPAIRVDEEGQPIPRCLDCDEGRDH